MLAWLSVWSEVHCHSLSLASVKSRLVLPFWYRLTRIVPGSLNGCVCVCVCVCVARTQFWKIFHIRDYRHTLCSCKVKQNEINRWKSRAGAGGGARAPVPHSWRRQCQNEIRSERAGARFTKYLTTILRLSYDNAKVTIDLRQTSNLQNILRRTQGFSYVQLTCKIVRSSKIVFVN